jgi:flagellar protein FliL
MAATKGISSDAELDEAEAEPRQQKISIKNLVSLKLIIVMAAVAIGVGSAGGGIYYLLASRGDTAKSAGVRPPVFFDMPDVLVNLSSSSGERTQYLKVKVVLELPNETVKAQIEPLMPRIMDTFQTYLRELRATDLDGSAGLYRLKEELTRRVNAAIAPNRINAVLFKEIVVQ